MHRTEGPDDFGGIYKDTAPATVINHQAMNALQEEIAGAVEWSGQTLAASGSDDATAGWRQLRNAIGELDSSDTLKTISLRLQSGNVVDAVDFNATYMLHTMRQMVTLYIPKVSFSVSPVSDFLNLKGGGGIDLPAAVRPKFDQTHFLISFHDDNYGYAGNTGIGSMVYDSAPNPNFGIWNAVNRAAGFDGALKFEACFLTYFV